MITGKVNGQFDLGTDVKIVNAEVLSYVVPKLRFRDKHKLVARLEVLCKVDYILSPDICKSAESQTFDTKEILHSPHHCKLYRNIARSNAIESLVKKFQV